MALMDFLHRNRAMDPFGGDDSFDDESSFAGKGPKIVLAASGVVFLGVVGFIAYVVMTGETQDAGPPMAGSFADLEIVEEPIDTPETAKAPTAVADATAATDRSASRRPWLTPQAADPTTAPRPGMDTAKPAAKPGPAEPAISPPTTTAAVTPPQPAAKPAAPAETQVAEAPPAEPPAEAPGEPDQTEPPREIAGIPALNEPGVAPGAPGLFDVEGDTGPAVAGGRPRLADPPLPPTDRVAISAPPPRFAALRDVRKETAAPAPSSAAKIAVVVGGLGLNRTATEAAISKLPAAVTLAFSPYARGLQSWFERAKAQGHEVLIEVPLESARFPAEDPGPLGLLTTLELKDTNERLDAIFKNASGAAGVFDSMGTKFRESDSALTPLFTKLQAQNLFYVQGSPGVRVGDAPVPTAVADVILDERPFRAAIDARLDYAERLAKYQGSAVAALSAKPVSFERLVLWYDQAQRKGVALVPISQILNR